jgi:hypothetical protein
MRRAPRPKPKPKAPTKAPIHQRIIGKWQIELDLLDDLETELEQSFKLDLIEYDDYLLCWQALEVRRQKANEGKLKAIGAYVKPDKKLDKQKENVRRCPKRPPDWVIKLGLFILAFIFYKIFC